MTLQQRRWQGRTVSRLLNGLDKLVTDWPDPGYVIDSLETDDHVTHDYVFCHEHALMVAHGDSILTGHAMIICDVSQSETDSEEYCAFYGCERLLNTGSPTDEWINSALGLTETDPAAAIVTPYELVRSASNMLDDDGRWPLWLRQARRVLQRQPGEPCRKRPAGQPRNKRPCTSCGALVPAWQDPPYPGHRRGCALVRKWRGSLPGRAPRRHPTGQS